MADVQPLLIVDDDESLLGLMATWLKQENYEIVTCSRYEDARQYLASQTPSALITDVRLGRYNGLQLALLVRDRQPDAAIVVVSAFDDPILKKEIDEIGGVFLSKPMRRDELVGTLRRARGEDV